jgi:hypothetical protein
VTKSEHCRNCGNDIAAAGAGRPRRYCRAACRQAAYRTRASEAAARDRGALAALAVRLRDNADRLWLISQGWAPAEGRPEDAVEALLAEAVAVVGEMTGQGRVTGDGIRDDPPPGSPD